MNTLDKEALLWFYNRFVYKYGENENSDYMKDFKRIIDRTTPAPIPPFEKALEYMTKALESHKWWHHVRGTPLENDIPVRATTAAFNLFGHQVREAYLKAECTNDAPLPWGDAPVSTMWAAMDRNGQWYWYDTKPLIPKNGFAWESKIGNCSPFTHPPVDSWEESLRSRPADSGVERDISYEEMYFKRGAELGALVARMHAINVYTAGMHAANNQRLHHGESLAYAEDSFVECAQQLEEIAERMLKL